MKKVKVKPLPKVGAEPEKVAKYFLDSARVRSVLFALIPAVIVLLRKIGIEMSEIEIQRYFEAFSALIGVFGAIYHLYLSHKKGDIYFLK